MQNDNTLILYFWVQFPVVSTEIMAKLVNAIVH